MKHVSFLPTFVAGCVLSGCNTMEGFGKDIQKAGEAIERKAK
jgi:predicted small secreted protein